VGGGGKCWLGLVGGGGRKKEGEEWGGGMKLSGEVKRSAPEGLPRE